MSWTNMTWHRRLGENFLVLRYTMGTIFEMRRFSRLLETTCSWLHMARALTYEAGELTAAPEQQNILSRAIAPDLPRDAKPKHWWELRSHVSGGLCEPWCLACNQRLRGGHAQGPSHAGKLLQKYGLDTLPGPTAACACRLALPPGIPKAIDADTSSAIAEWLPCPGDTFMMVRAIPESGLQCMLGKHPQAIGECLQEGSRVVRINGRETDDPDLVFSGLFSFWVQIDLSTDCLGQEMLFAMTKCQPLASPSR